MILELSNGLVRSKSRKICGVRSLMESLGEEEFEWKNGKIIAQRNAIEQKALFTSVQKRQVKSGVSALILFYSPKLSHRAQVKRLKRGSQKEVDVLCHFLLRLGHLPIKMNCRSYVIHSHTKKNNGPRLHSDDKFIIPSLFPRKAESDIFLSISKCFIRI